MDVYLRFKSCTNWESVKRQISVSIGRTLRCGVRYTRKKLLLAFLKFKTTNSGRQFLRRIRNSSAIPRQVLTKKIDLILGSASMGLPPAELKLGTGHSGN